jgi:hypothetical protein
LPPYADVGQYVWIDNDRSDAKLAPSVMGVMA